MKKNVMKFLILFMVFILFSAFNFTSSYALDEIISDADGFLQVEGDADVLNKTTLQTESKNLYNILFTIGVVLAVAVGMIIGIQFVMASSADDKAKIKETLIPYVIGVFVIFGAFTIWKIAVNIGNDVTKTSVSGSSSGKQTKQKQEDQSSSPSRSTGGR